MSPLASWLVVGAIVFAAIAVGLVIVYWIGKDQWNHRGENRWNHRGDDVQ